MLQRQKDRIRQIAAQLSPGCEVRFDEETHFLKFVVYGSAGVLLVEHSEDRTPDEWAALSDAEVRERLNLLSGGKMWPREETSRIFVGTLLTIGQPGFKDDPPRNPGANLDSLHGTVLNLIEPGNESAPLLAKLKIVQADLGPRLLWKVKPLVHKERSGLEDGIAISQVDTSNDAEV
jgi:hypothetical protein